MTIDKYLDIVADTWLDMYCGTFDYKDFRNGVESHSLKTDRRNQC